MISWLPPPASIHSPISACTWPTNPLQHHPTLLRSFLCCLAAVHLSSPSGPLFLIPSQDHNVNQIFSTRVMKILSCLCKQEYRCNNKLWGQSLKISLKKNVARLEKLIRTCKIFYSDADWVIQKRATEGKQPPSWLWIFDLYFNSICINMYNKTSRTNTQLTIYMYLKSWVRCVCVMLVTWMSKGNEDHLAYRHITTSLTTSGFHIS